MESAEQTLLHRLLVVPILPVLIRVIQTVLVELLILLLVRGVVMLVPVSQVERIVVPGRRVVMEDACLLRRLHLLLPLLDLLVPQGVILGGFLRVVTMVSWCKVSFVQGVIVQLMR